VELVWDDSEQLQLGWDHREEYLRLAAEQSLHRSAGYWQGWAGKGRQRRAVVALSVAERSGRITEVMAIPAACVRSLRKLR
jgi:hypothetical protein